HRPPEEEAIAELYGRPAVGAHPNAGCGRRPEPPLATCRAARRRAATAQEPVPHRLRRTDAPRCDGRPSHITTSDPARRRQEKRSARAALFKFSKETANYAAVCSDSPLACTGPESCPFASISRSTNSMTAIGAESP